MDELRLTDYVSANAALSAAGHELWGSLPPVATPHGWTWHHVHGTRRLELVPVEVKALLRHHGGLADSVGRPRQARHPAAAGDPAGALRAAQGGGVGHRAAGPRRRGGAGVPAARRLPHLPQGGGRLRAQGRRARPRPGAADRPAVLHRPRRRGGQRPGVREQVPARPPHQGLPGHRVRPGRHPRRQGEGGEHRLGVVLRRTTTRATASAGTPRPTGSRSCCCRAANRSTPSCCGWRAIRRSWRRWRI